ncbi:MAG: hypothetical protein A2504_12465 [Bdellovibrionales bacterium RIFOXYD12_FULL_39_22]|nr:MAG: hypothetical protein A2385_00195 [Bdellovibrionales bacterium RIFOXYB1_FULL_39_21]OFZ44076.1 MAG: hypothetical protein A2485_03860 [Bdellovibrionales bacterium RIFOXYC12_FULL_39_17]OFZ48522.1 MAG: hypothetical protein A2404_07210 [Bdellovibrionales bacterium RIFOXYC1_FULL_39_130]OFZ71330.1 MAG: hypothetical protein A2451_10025 [Bdellovibrionales bacterium RIFOXYC2_FULL_39_8]OFZ76710.1 MAG: hypothetical protein A2560_11585 [Bdellovibrionales bacterium RIFOXYD1_FULL_39_84]OFZ94988.1 MAG:
MKTILFLSLISLTLCTSGFFGDSAFAQGIAISGAMSSKEKPYCTKMKKKKQAAKCCTIADAKKKNKCAAKYKCQCPSPATN